MKTDLKVAFKQTGDVKTTSEKTLYENLKKLPGANSRFNLTSNQKYWYNLIGTELMKTGQLTKMNLPHLHFAAFWLDAFCQAATKINELGYKGLVQTFTTGATNITGHVSILKDAKKQFEDASANFGWSFKDLAKLKPTETDPNQLDIFQQFLTQQKAAN